MNERIDQFREIFRLKLMQADSDLSALKAKIDAKAETAERDARACLNEVAKRIKQNEPRTATNWSRAATASPWAPNARDANRARDAPDGFGPPIGDESGNDRWIGHDDDPGPLLAHKAAGGDGAGEVTANGSGRVVLAGG